MKQAHEGKVWDELEEDAKWATLEAQEKKIQELEGRLGLLEQTVVVLASVSAPQ